MIELSSSAQATIIIRLILGTCSWKWPWPKGVTWSSGSGAETLRIRTLPRFPQSAPYKAWRRKRSDFQDAERQQSNKHVVVASTEQPGAWIKWNGKRVSLLATTASSGQVAVPFSQLSVGTVNQPRAVVLNGSSRWSTTQHSHSIGWDSMTLLACGTAPPPLSLHSPAPLPTPTSPTSREVVHAVAAGQCFYWFRC